MATPTIEISVVAPALNEEASLPALVERVAAALAGRRFELVVALDGCTDGSLPLLRRLQEHYPVVIVELAERAGQHPALAAGLAQASGALLLTIDADLQNPPEALPLLAARLEAGCEAVGTVRQRRQDPTWRLVASSLFAGTLALVGARHRMGDPGCMLRGWRRQVWDRFQAGCRPPLYLPLQLNELAASYCELEIPHASRPDGASRYAATALARLFLRVGQARWPRLAPPRPPARVKAVWRPGESPPAQPGRQEN